MAINGIVSAMGKGMILEPIAAYLKGLLGTYWFKPFGGCIQCSASGIGGFLYWGTIISIFGFHLIEIWVWLFDICVLVYLNYFFYKRM